MHFITLYLIFMVLNWLVWIGDDEYVMAAFFSFIPILNIVCGIGGILKIFQVYKNSKGKCFLNHKGALIYDSEAEKWKDGRMPLRISRGGVEEYQCSKCGHKWYKSWKAF